MARILSLDQGLSEKDATHADAEAQDTGGDGVVSVSVTGEDLAFVVACDGLFRIFGYKNKQNMH